MDGFLIVSQNGGGNCATAPNTDTVKTNLASEIGSSPDNGLNKNTVLSAQGFGDSETSGPSEFGQGGMKFELKQFAAGFFVFLLQVVKSIYFKKE